MDPEDVGAVRAMSRSIEGDVDAIADALSGGISDGDRGVIELRLEQIERKANDIQETTQ